MALLLSRDDLPRLVARAGLPVNATTLAMAVGTAALTLHALEGLAPFRDEVDLIDASAHVLAAVPLKPKAGIRVEEASNLRAAIVRESLRRRLAIDGEDGRRG